MKKYSQILLTLLQTSKAVHFAVVNTKDGRNVTSIERKIPLITIKSIAMSNLRDDWMVSFLLLKHGKL